MTTVVIAKTLREIVVAADSLSVTTGGEVNTLCKIVQVKNHFFSSSGLQGNAQVGDVYSIARQAGQSSSDIASCLRRFIKLVHPLLRRAVLEHKKDSHEFYKSRIEGKTIVDASLFGVEHNELVLGRVRATVRADDTLVEGFRIVYKGKDNVELGEEPLKLVLLGEQLWIRRQLGGDPNSFFSKRGIVEASRQLVQLEIDRAPKYVGPPIAILRIDRSGAKWVQRTPNCKSIKKPKNLIQRGDSAGLNSKAR